MERLLTQLADTVAAAEDLEGLTRPLLELLETVTGMESTYLTRIDESVGQQHIVFARNTRQMQIPEGLAVPWGDTLCKRALEENRPHTDDVAACWGDSDAARQLGIRTYLSQPVHYGDGRLYGTLCAASAARKPVAPESLKILAMFAKILTLQVDRQSRLEALRRHNANLSARAHSDALTGLPNRRALIEALGRALARGGRVGSSIAVAFIDLDGFKAINDRHGRAVGDRLLQRIAERLTAVSRASEILARYGGDQFVLVAEDAEARELQDRLERVIPGRYEFGDAAVEVRGVSVGVATAHIGEAAEAVLKRAEASMQAVKQRTRAARPQPAR